MIISIVIALCCFIILVFEITSVYLIFKKSDKITCTVISSHRQELRENGYLVKLYWDTEVVFSAKGEEKTATLQTSTYCQKGQKFIYYYDKKNSRLFRKRDLKLFIKPYLYVAFSIGVLFLAIHGIMSFFSFDIITKDNLINAALWVLSAIFVLVGATRLTSSILDIKRSSKRNIVKIRAEICDAIVRISKHNENNLSTYYPVYHYKFGDEEHEVKSKLGRRVPPKIGSFVTIPVSKKNGGPIETDHPATTLFEAAAFIIFGIFIIVIKYILQ